jgi:hypothetical protein
MRIALLREFLLLASAEQAARLLTELVRCSLVGYPPGEDGLLAFVPCMIDLRNEPQAYARIAEIYAFAKAEPVRPTPAPQLEEHAELSAAPDELAQAEHEPISAWSLDEDLRLAELSRELEVPIRLPEPPRAIEELEPQQRLVEQRIAPTPSSAPIAPRDAEALLQRWLGYLLVEPPSARKPPLRMHHFAPKWDRPLSLGERKALAVGSNRLALEKLLYDLDPSVVAKLCANPRVLEQDILLVATRRPNTPTILDELARSHWLSRYAVRHALALNPFSRSSLVLRILPLLHEQDLHAFCYATQTHPIVQDAARDLAALRDLLCRPAEGGTS